MVYALTEGIRKDVGLALRSVLRTPGPVLLIIVLFGLGVGGVLTIFGPLYSLVLSPLPFPDSDHLVRMGGDLPIFDIYSQTFLRRRELNPIFSAVTAFAVTQGKLSKERPQVEVNVAAVTPEFFQTIGVSPRRGVDLSDSPVDAQVAVISDAFWRDRMQAKSDAVGQSILLNNKLFIVLGIMPADFNFPSNIQIWAPAGSIYEQSNYQFIGRLAPGQSLDRASLELQAVENAARQNGNLSSGGPILELLHTFLLGDRRPLVWILWSASLLFLLLACAGVSNILFARGVGRRSEVVVRLALGATRRRLIAQFLVETLVLAAAGSALGLAVSLWGTRALRVVLPSAPAAHFGSLVFATLVGVLALTTTVISGLAPAFHSTKADLSQSLKTNSSGAAASISKRRVLTSHEFLAGCQLVLAMILLISVGLLFRSLVAWLHLPLGFDPQDVAVVETDLPQLPETIAAERNYDLQNPVERGRRVSPELAAARRAALKGTDDIEKSRDRLFYRTAIDQMSHLPGAVSAAILTPPPFQQDASQQERILFFGYDRRVASFGPKADCLLRYVSADSNAFSLLKINLVEGRTFFQSDAVEFANRWNSVRAGSQSADSGVVPNVIVNETLARRFWPTQSALGKELSWASTFRLRVVGVTSDIRETPGQLEVQPTVYFPFFEFWTAKTSFVVKLLPGTPISTFAASARSTLAELAPDLPDPEVTSLRDSATASLANLRLALALLSMFSALGTTVAALSVYATATFMSVVRTSEMGVRLALGATPGQIRLLAFWRSARLGLFALPIGALVSWALARELSHWLFRVGTADPLSYLASSVLLMLITAAAALIPALRVGATDPAVALRYDG
jgi:putative ABC transport system permease protein